MEYLLFSIISLPLLGFIISLIIPKAKEFQLAFLVKSVTLLNFIVTFCIVVFWLFNGAKPINFHEITLYKSGEYVFYIDLFFDKASAVYLLFSTFLIFLIAKFSQYYLHREEGYKRFFNTFLLFNFGLVLLLISGNFETMFIGWEILGLSSFLLISFYRDRYLPVKNAMKIFSIYRIGDIALILAMWLSHHLLHANIAFSDVRTIKEVQYALATHSTEAVLISIMIFIAVSVKSAQFPFSSWLPRAMEGPTPSSAIFYGSLAIHIGAFLLIRTMPFWEDHLFIRISFGFIGLITAVIAYFTAKVQSSIKSLVAYSSITQLGIIIIEISLGFEIIALIHITANVFYRTYQLLISPSSVSYKIREQFYHFEELKPSIEDSLPKKLENTLYSLSLREWNLATHFNVSLWKPIVFFSSILYKIPNFIFLSFFGIAIIISVLELQFDFISETFTHQFLPLIYAIVGSVMVFKSFGKRNRLLTSWLLIIANQVMVVLAVVFNEKITLIEIAMYSVGVMIAGISGLFLIRYLEKREGKIYLTENSGHIFEYKKLGFLFLLSCLVLAGFPISPSFIGEDILFSHIEEHQYALIVFMAMSFVLDGISLIRMYSRVFLGPHCKNYHPVAQRSA